MSDISPPEIAYDGIIESSLFIHVLAKDHDIGEYRFVDCLETIIDNDESIYTRFAILFSSWRAIWFETANSAPPRSGLDEW